MIRLLILTTAFLLCGEIDAQSKLNQSNYIGLLPSVLVEPYDTINAIEINTIPLVFEHRYTGSGIALQIRPVINYRFYRLQSGISQTGFTVLVNRYFSTWFEDKKKIVLLTGLFNTYTYNQLDQIHTLTLGLEPGIMFIPNDQFTINMNLQPGINYYPDDFSKHFARAQNGFKAHFGIIIHFGYNF